MCICMQAELKKKYTEEQLPIYLDNLEKLLKENNDGGGYFVGDDVSNGYYANDAVFIIGLIVCSLGSNN